jgi:hypothetical protein
MSLGASIEDNRGIVPNNRSKGIEPAVESLGAAGTTCFAEAQSRVQGVESRC